MIKRPRKSNKAAEKVYKRKRITRKRLISSPKLWKQAPAGFAEKYGHTSNVPLMVPKHVKHPGKSTLTAPAGLIEELGKARGTKRARIKARLSSSVQSIKTKLTPIAERVKKAPPKQTRLVPVVQPDGSFTVVKLTGELLEQARARAEAMYWARKKGKRAPITAYENQYKNPDVIGETKGRPNTFINDPDVLATAKATMSKRKRIQLDKLYAEMFA